MVLSIFVILAVLSHAEAHGFLKQPRSRNWVAAADGLWWGGNESTPLKESCPHCLNRGGMCGVSESGNAYNVPLNIYGVPLGKNVQATYTTGQEFDVEVVLTAHHKGHFEFYVCAEEPRTPSCFKPVEFVADLLYNAPKHAAYPSRAYLPPADYGLLENFDFKEAVTKAVGFRYRLKLPDDLVGDFVLLQWRYLTGNSCIHPGYRDYNWPSDWNDPVGGLSDCGPLPPDGGGIPEQFWNCAEITIVDASDPTTPAPTDASMKAPTHSPTTAPPPQSSPSLCCPEGFTGMSPASNCQVFYHCANGIVDGPLIPCPAGTLFNKNLQNCDWANAFTCDATSLCSDPRSLRGQNSAE